MVETLTNPQNKIQLTIGYSKHTSQYSTPGSTSCITCEAGYACRTPTELPVRSQIAHTTSPALIVLLLQMPSWLLLRLWCHHLQDLFGRLDVCKHCA